MATQAKSIGQGKALQKFLAALRQEHNFAKKQRLSEGAVDSIKPAFDFLWMADTSDFRSKMAEKDGFRFGKKMVLRISR